MAKLWLPLDANSHPVPILRPVRAHTVNLEANTSHSVGPFEAGTRVVTLYSEICGTFFALGRGDVVATEDDHYIGPKERLVVSVLPEQTHLAVYFSLDSAGPYNGFKVYVSEMA